MSFKHTRKPNNSKHYSRKKEKADLGTPVDVVKARFKHLANTGDEISNTTAAGFGALIAGIVIVVRRFQKEDK